MRGQRRQQRLLEWGGAALPAQLALFSATALKLLVRSDATAASSCPVCAAVLAAASPAVTAPVSTQGVCKTAVQCYGLGDCVNGRCVCDPWASGAPDCSAFVFEPVDWTPAPGYRNLTQPSWSGSFLHGTDAAGSPVHAFVGAMTPGFVNRTFTYGDPEVVHLVSASDGLGGPFRVVGSPLRGHFQSQVHPLPESQGGGHVLFSNTAVGSGQTGLTAGRIGSLDSVDLGAVAMTNVYSPKATDPAYPWVCATNDWGATVLPDGSVVALFRNGGRHCANGSYPGWPEEKLGLLRASCWNCSDYRVITPTPLFEGLPSGSSNEDGFLWWSHRGLHMVLHSQDTSDPSVPHQVRGAVAFSPDITKFAPESWVLSPTPAYNQSVALRNGSAAVALRRQRPQLVFRDAGAEKAVSAAPSPHGWPRRGVTHLSNAADFMYGENGDGWGDAWAMLLPLRQR